MHTARRPFLGSRRRRSGSPLFAQLLTAAVESAATEVAIRFNPTGDPAHQREITYQELDEGSSRLARELIERGIGPGDSVAIGLARSPESVLAIWAIAKTGAAHVPIDPGLPGDRIDRMAAGSGAVLGLTTSRYRSALGRSLYWMELDDPVQAERITRRARHPISYADRVRMLDASHPAYIAYTSAPGGEHTGVVVPHSGLAPVVAAATDHYGITSDSRVAHMCSPDVDVSVLELLLTFSSGATLVLVPAGKTDGRHLTDLLVREQVTHVFTTPAALASVDPAKLTGLHVVAAIGGACDFEPIGRWAHERNFFTGYGRTEAGVIATGPGTTAPGAPITVGAALNGAGVFVLDSRLRPVPTGVVGELYLSGPALAHGYLGRRGLTAQHFVAAPFGAELGRPGARMYRTGDLVRRIVTPRGEELEYLGRSGSRVAGRGAGRGEVPQTPRDEFDRGALPQRLREFAGGTVAPNPAEPEALPVSIREPAPPPIHESGHGGPRAGRPVAGPAGNFPASGREGERRALPERGRGIGHEESSAGEFDRAVLPGSSHGLGSGAVPAGSADDFDRVAPPARSHGRGGEVLPRSSRGREGDEAPVGSAGESERVALPQRSRGLRGEVPPASGSEFDRAVLPGSSREREGGAVPVGSGREFDRAVLPGPSRGREGGAVPGGEVGRGVRPESAPELGGGAVPVGSAGESERVVLPQRSRGPGGEVPPVPGGEVGRGVRPGS
ncbi:AMP-binding protein, partial [Nocardia sp. NPDC050799]|uniref:AMP-binding protein n=1 Tax=Nocardia sp. NPDC050799 TaxID=3154842 RepID=UPI0034104E0C